MKKTLRPSGGHILDIDSSEIADQFLSSANNVNTRKGFPSRIGGRRVAYSGGSFGANALHLMNFNLNTFNWWLALKASTIVARQGAVTTDVSYASQIAVVNPYEWSSGLLNGIPVFTNGKNPLLYWTGDAGDDADVVPGWPASTICRAVAIFRFHIFALNIDNASGTFENMIMWSDATDPGALPASWTPGADNEAGSAILAETEGRCVCGLAIATQLNIYKPTSIFAVEYVGQQPDNIFTVRPINRSVGALSAHCVLEIFNNTQLAVGNDDVVLVDTIGGTRSIADNRIKTYLANQIDETNALNVFAVRDLNRRETWVCVPEAGNQFATIAHVWDERRDTWVTRSLNFVRHARAGFVSDTAVSDVWDDDAGTWDSDLNPWTVNAVNTRSRLVTAESADLYIEDTNDITNITATLQKLDMAFDDDTQRKITKRVWIYGTGAGMAGMEFRLGSRQSTDENISWGNYSVRAAEGTPYEVEGRYISLEIRKAGTDPFTINRIVIQADFNGPY